MLIPFIKAHAQGNDFVVWDLHSQYEIPSALDKLAIAICDRRFGVGADGLVLITHADDADARMTIFNSDGSRAAMCGSALRCVARMLSNITGRNSLCIATDSGIKTAEVKPHEVAVDLGAPRFLEQSIYLKGLLGNVVDIGNLHFVSVHGSLDDAPHMKYGPLLEADPTFPQGLNSQFVRVTGKNEIEMLIWERGAGATMACGTGAVAAVFSCSRGGLILPNAVVDVPGGRVHVWETPSGSFYLAGDVVTAFHGEYEWRI